MKSSCNAYHLLPYGDAYGYEPLSPGAEDQTDDRVTTGLQPPQAMQRTMPPAVSPVAPSRETSSHGPDRTTPGSGAVQQHQPPSLIPPQFALFEPLGMHADCCELAMWCNQHARDPSDPDWARLYVHAAVKALAEIVTVVMRQVPQRQNPARLQGRRHDSSRQTANARYAQRINRQFHLLHELSKPGTPAKRLQQHLVEMLVQAMNTCVLPEIRSHGNEELCSELTMLTRKLESFAATDDLESTMEALNKQPVKVFCKLMPAYCLRRSLTQTGKLPTHVSACIRPRRGQVLDHMERNQAWLESALSSMVQAQKNPRVYVLEDVRHIYAEAPQQILTVYRDSQKIINRLLPHYAREVDAYERQLSRLEAQIRSIPMAGNFEAVTDRIHQLLGEFLKAFESGMQCMRQLQGGLRHALEQGPQLQAAAAAAAQTHACAPSSEDEDDADSEDFPEDDTEFDALPVEPAPAPATSTASTASPTLATTATTATLRAHGTADAVRHAGTPIPNFQWVPLANTAQALRSMAERQQWASTEALEAIAERLQGHELGMLEYPERERLLQELMPHLQHCAHSLVFNAFPGLFRLANACPTAMQLRKDFAQLAADNFLRKDEDGMTRMAFRTLVQSGRFVEFLAEMRCLSFQQSRRMFIKLARYFSGNIDPAKDRESFCQALEDQEPGTSKPQAAAVRTLMALAAHAASSPSARRIGMLCFQLFGSPPQLAQTLEESTSPEEWRSLALVAFCGDKNNTLCTVKKDRIKINPHYAGYATLKLLLEDLMRPKGQATTPAYRQIDITVGSNTHTPLAEQSLRSCVANAAVQSGWAVRHQKDPRVLSLVRLASSAAGSAR